MIANIDLVFRWAFEEAILLTKMFVLRTDITVVSVAFLSIPITITTRYVSVDEN